VRGHDGQDRYAEWNWCHQKNQNFSANKDGLNDKTFSNNSNHFIELKWPWRMENGTCCTTEKQCIRKCKSLSSITFSVYSRWIYFSIFIIHVYGEYRISHINFTIIHRMCTQRISKICHGGSENILNFTVHRVHARWTRADLCYFPR